MKTMKACRRSLIKQLRMLSEASYKQMWDEGLSSYSHEMVEIYKELERPFRTIFFCFMLMNFFAYFAVFIKKFGRGKI